MIPVRIKNADMAFGKPAGWKKGDPEFGTLYARREHKDGLPVILSAWKPSADELEVLNSGGTLVLGLVGNVHPPVVMYVSEED